MPLEKGKADVFIRLAPSKRQPSVQTVTTLTGLGKTTIYRLMAAGKFPKAVPIAGASVVRWRLSDVFAWMDAQAAGKGE